MSVANKVVLDWNGSERRIYLKQGITEYNWMDDIYTEYRDERRNNEDFRKWDPFLVASGNVSKGNGKATPRLVTLLDGVKVIAWDENIEITVGGEAITDNADIDATLFDNSTRTQPLIINYEPPSAEVIVVDEIQDSLDYGGVLHFDMNNVDGVGQVHPVGTSANPVNNVPDGLVIAAKYFLHKVLTFSNITMTQGVSGFTVIGATPDLIFNPGGFQMSLSNFINLEIDGDFNNSHIHVKDCVITEALNVSGQIVGGFHVGRILIMANGDLKLKNVASGIPGLGSPLLDMNQGQDTSFSGRSISGGLTVEYCDTPNCIATMGFSDGGKPHLEPSNTAGMLSIRGSGELDDRSNGTTIEKKSWIESSDIDLMRAIMEGDINPTATQWEILDKISKAILVKKNRTVNGDGFSVLTEPV